MTVAPVTDGVLRGVTLTGPGSSDAIATSKGSPVLRYTVQDVTVNSFATAAIGLRNGPFQAHAQGVPLGDPRLLDPGDADWLFQRAQFRENATKQGENDTWFYAERATFDTCVWDSTGETNHAVYAKARDARFLSCQWRDCPRAVSPRMGGFELWFGKFERCSEAIGIYPYDITQRGGRIVIAHTVFDSCTDWILYALGHQVDDTENVDAYADWDLYLFGLSFPNSSGQGINLTDVLPVLEARGRKVYLDPGSIPAGADWEYGLKPTKHPALVIGTPPGGWPEPPAGPNSPPRLPAPGALGGVSNRLTLWWNPVPGAAAYDVFAHGAFMKRVSTPWTYIAKIASHTTYRFDVCAVDADGNRGDLAPAIYRTTL